MLKNKSAAAYLLKGNIYVQGYAVTTEGLSWLHGLVFTISENDQKLIGNNILAAFQNAGKVIPHPTWEELQKEGNDSLLLEATKMKTWGKLMKSSKSIGIELLEAKNSIQIIPYKYIGRHGYEPLEEKAITTDLDPQHIGEAVLKAFELCE